jgi:hypothetical protein
LNHQGLPGKRKALIRGIKVPGHNVPPAGAVQPRLPVESIALPIKLAFRSAVRAAHSHGALPG